VPCDALLHCLSSPQAAWHAPPLQLPTCIASHRAQEQQLNPNSRSDRTVHAQQLFS
jgi:hypothetical protein